MLELELALPQDSAQPPQRRALSSPPGCRFHLPVSIADPLELLAQEAGQERPHSASFYQGLSNGPYPDVNVVRGLVEIQQLAGQPLVPQHSTQLLQRPWL